MSKRRKKRIAPPATSTRLRRHLPSRKKLIGAVVIIMAIASSLYAINRFRNQTSSAVSQEAESAHCDTDIASARAAHHAQLIEPVNNDSMRAHFTEWPLTVSGWIGRK